MPLLWCEHHPQSSQVHLQDVGTDSEGQKPRGAGVKASWRQQPLLIHQSPWTGLSWHSNMSQGTFLFLWCNNLTGIDKMKYILESLSSPVRLDHDRNILSYECLNVVVKVSRDSSPLPGYWARRKPCFYHQGYSGFLWAMFSQHLPSPPPPPIPKSRVALVCIGIFACSSSIHS